MALNVLVVDDSSVMRAMIIRTLRLSGLPLAKIYQCANGKEGLQVLDDNWIDLALVDINMPIMSGEEMIDRIRQDPDMSDLPVIVISSESSKSRVEILQRKIDGFVHKPFTPEILRETIISIIAAELYEEQNGEGTLQGGSYDF